jgi:hypothetical protein
MIAGYPAYTYTSKRTEIQKMAVHMVSFRAGNRPTSRGR